MAKWNEILILGMLSQPHEVYPKFQSFILENFCSIQFFNWNFHNFWSNGKHPWPLVLASYLYGGFLLGFTHILEKSHQLRLGQLKVKRECCQVQWKQATHKDSHMNNVHVQHPSNKVPCYWWDNSFQSSIIYCMYLQAFLIQDLF